MFEGINEIAILVSAILAVAVGNIWYSPLVFGNVWMRAVGIRPGEDVFPKDKVVGAVLKGVCVQVVFFLTLAFLMQGINASVYTLSEVAGILTLIIALQALSTVIWEQKPFMYFLVNAGYVGVIILGGLAVITYWPW
jgi:hypothetical protein